ncbi:hypothetical protein [Chitinibacter sp. GC72]|uniref:hypothetical protein n=1 Tax=Chitinibacter sp. GC72 TaxID=1526917 RepID=UPI0012FBCFF7|nr:hypothetical protein [Chitinibacter sp. GC72]
MFGLLNRAVSVAVNVAVVPVAVVADVVTLGGSLTDQSKPYTAQRVGKAFDQAMKMADEVGKD